MVPSQKKRNSRLKRVRKSRERLKGILSRTDCLKCGRCCKRPGGGFSVSVVNNDPLFDEIRGLTEARFPERIVQGESQFDIGGTDRCSFLGDGNLCSVYAKRPIICSIFPFNTMPLGVLDGRILVGTGLSTLCVPILEAKRRGINYVTLDDIGRFTGSGDVVDGLPLLAECAGTLLKHIISGVLPNTLIMREDGMVMFPITSGVL